MSKLKTSLFSQSLFALSLSEAIAGTAEAGFGSIELACCEPHFGLRQAHDDPGCIAEQIEEAGLTTAALSLFTSFTETESFDEHLDQATTFIRLAPLFKTSLVKITPGPPGSLDAMENHWKMLSNAIDRLIPIADNAGVCLAFETHMRQLTDTLSASERLMEMFPTNTVGMTVDFSNLRFAGERMSEVVRSLCGKMVHTHVKNGHIDKQGRWHFGPLDQGLTDYAEVFSLLGEVNYHGYLSIECLGPDSADQPIATARRNLKLLRKFHEQAGLGPLE